MHCYSKPLQDGTFLLANVCFLGELKCCYEACIEYISKLNVAHAAALSNSYNLKWLYQNIFYFKF